MAEVRQSSTLVRKVGTRQQGVPRGDRVHNREAEQPVGNHGGKAKVDEWSSGGSSGETPSASLGLGRQESWRVNLSCSNQVE